MKHNKLSILGFTPIVAALMFNIGCDAVGKDDLAILTLEGNIDLQGDAPADYEFEVYGIVSNEGAFDPSYCDDVSADCWGRVNVDELSTPADHGAININGGSFTIEDLSIDAAFILVGTGIDDAITCSTDVVGFDETTKVINADSAITFDFDDLELTSLSLPRDVSLNCVAPPEAPEPPADPEPEEAPPADVEEEVIDEESGDIMLPPDAELGWDTFSITDKNGATTYADASAGSVAAENLTCDENFPSVLSLHGTTNSTAEVAYIRIQFGSGVSSTYTTIEAPLDNGVLNQEISLTGGYAVVQLDTDETLDAVGESHTVTFCEPSSAPAQEMLTILTWDKDDTDVDTHVYSAGQEVAYYSMHRSWGDLDIDDVNGFGPETFTSTPETSGQDYEVRVHYYSDHGNGPTEVTIRVVYYDQSTGETCDVTATQTMASHDWWSVGMFGPGLACP